jgi:hypothetical protein
MELGVDFDLDTGMYTCVLLDDDGCQLGFIASSENLAKAAFALGRAFGAHPELFARELRDYFDGMKEKPIAA